jgi:hypothetical protein
VVGSFWRWFIFNCRVNDTLIRGTPVEFVLQGVMYTLVLSVGLESTFLFLTLELNEGGDNKISYPKDVC